MNLLELAVALLAEVHLVKYKSRILQFEFVEEASRSLAQEIPETGLAELAVATQAGHSLELDWRGASAFRPLAQEKAAVKHGLVEAQFADEVRLVIERDASVLGLGHAAQCSSQVVQMRRLEVVIVFVLHEFVPILD